MGEEIEKGLDGLDANGINWIAHQLDEKIWLYFEKRKAKRNGRGETASSRS